MFTFAFGLVLSGLGVALLLVTRAGTWRRIYGRSVEVNPVTRFTHRRLPVLARVSVAWTRRALRAIGAVLVLLGPAIAAAALAG